MLEPSLELYGETYDKVDQLLSDLITKSQSRYALIIDLKGFVLVHSKALWAPKPPSLDSLATLVASNYSANVAIAKLFNEQGFKEMVQQGDSVGLYCEELEEKALLVTVFDDSTALGRVKLFSKKAVDEIRRVLASSEDKAPTVNFDEAWQTSTKALIDGLFGSRDS
jgi:predicted regulator of Ras-like GTPase activity (Roadblock/LC7/MglB family)